ncbi:MAG: hypothetical protein RMJ34_05135, partial [candidate division WOR-3 bacterium]|nr:hypothetical protein [candidate division WOR-3 bacterium]
MNKSIFFLLLFNFLFAKTLIFSYKFTRDTTLKYYRAFFMGNPKTSVSLIRKDFNKLANFIGDPYWKKIHIIYFNDFNYPPINWGIKSFSYPDRNFNDFFRCHSLSIDTAGNLFVVAGDHYPPDFSFKRKIFKFEYNWNTNNLNYLREISVENVLSCGITVMANDSLSPERSFWVCDSVNNRIIKFDYDGNFQAQFFGLLNPRIIARGRSLNNYEYYLYVVDNNSRRVVRLKHNKNNNSTTFVNERTFDFEISDLEFDGTLWIADNTNSRLLRLKEDLSEVVYTFGSYGTGRNQFKGINHITIPIGI